MHDGFRCVTMGNIVFDCCEDRIICSLRLNNSCTSRFSGENATFFQESSLISGFQAVSLDGY